MKSSVYYVIAILLALVCSAYLIDQPAMANSEFLCSNVQEIPQAECDALVALYNSTNGDGWTDHTNWLTDYTISNWFGVIVTSNHVTELNLNNNQLNGKIPSQIGNLIYLGWLNLAFNRLAGEIPAEIWNLTTLLELRLSDNQLTGSIPPEIGNLVNLVSLGLDRNRITGIIPAEIGNLVGLQVLELFSNDLEGSLPLQIGNLANLNRLYASDNRLTGSIPPEISNLSYLADLSLASNQLTGDIPSSLGSLEYLQYLYLGYNQLSGSIPIELGNIPYLIELTLNDNQLTGTIPESLGYPELLSVLWLNGNQLEGDIPSSFLDLTNLLNPGQWYGRDGLDLDYNMIAVPPGYPVPGDPLHEFLSQKDPDWQLYQGFKQTVGMEGGEIQSLDGKTIINIPQQALDQAITFTFRPLPLPSHGVLLKYAHNSFDLSGVDFLGNPFQNFSLPIAIRLNYTDEDIYSIPEGNLQLDYWQSESNSWVDAVNTCPGGEYVRHPEENWISVPVCHLTEFGLFGETMRTLMPFLER